MDELKRFYMQLPLYKSDEFAQLFTQGCEAFGWSTQEAAQRFETSPATIRRWKTGKSIPAAVSLIRQHFDQLVTDKIKHDESFRDLDSTRTYLTLVAKNQVACQRAEAELENEVNRLHILKSKGMDVTMLLNYYTTLQKLVQDIKNDHHKRNPYNPA